MSASTTAPSRTAAVWQGLLRLATSNVTVSIVCALLIGVAIIALSGRNPFVDYAAMVQGIVAGSGPANVLQRAIPIVGLAIGLSVAFRAGAFNLGAEGQMMLGAFAGTLTTLTWVSGGVLALVAAILVGAAAGAVWALVPVLLQRSTRAPILITSLLLSYVANAFVSYMVRFPLRDTTTELVATAAIPPESRLGALIPAASPLGGWLSAHFGQTSALIVTSRLVNWSLVIVIFVVVIVAIVNARTPAGLEAKTVGLNEQFARYLGIGVGKIGAFSMAASGAIAGAFGVMLVVGSDYRLIDGSLTATNYPWTALLVALLAGNRAIGTAVAGTFFAALIVGGEAAERTVGTSSQIAAVIQAVVIILVGMSIALPVVRRRRRSTRAVPDDEKVGIL